jgi:uncharacterized protein YndB with AHSA1/START domain
MTTWKKLAFMSFPLLAAIAGVNGRPAFAEVVESSGAGFSLKSVVRIAGPSERVYAALAQDVGRWWDPEHTYSGDSRNLSIDPKPGGCFCERLADQGGVQHLSVVLVIPRQQLRFAGGLGPLQESGVTGSLTWDLASKDGGTEVTWTYVVGGFRPGGLQALASLVDSVLNAQLQRFKDFVERGTPTP